MSFPRYPKYKDSGVEWLGEVPEHWSVCALSYRYKVALGKMLDEKRISGTHLAPYLRNTDVQWGKINIEDLPQMDFHGDDLARYSLRRGDLLVCEGGEVGRAAIWEATLDECYYQKALHRIRPENPDRDSAEFLYFVFRAAAMTGIFAGSGEKATIAHLTAEALRRYRFPFPTLSEQVSIAKSLNRETGKIDELVAEQQRLMELLKEKRQAVISHAVTKGLNPHAPMKPSGIEWLGDVPEHWKVTELKRIASIQTGVAKGKDNGFRATISVPYLRVANVQDGYLDLEDVATIEIPVDDLERYKLRRGDVLMNEGGDFDKLGRGCVWDGQIDPCISQNHVFAVRPEEGLSAWLNLLAGSDSAQFYFMTRSKQSTNLASISSTNLMELPVIIPPLIEREAILSFIGKQTSRLDTLAGEAKHAIDLLQERRTALISAAVTGHIDVRKLAAS